MPIAVMSCSTSGRPRPSSCVGEVNMFGSWRIARILGIDLSIHWTFWLLPVWIILTWNPNESTLMPLWMHLILIGCLFVCVVLHEFGHALTAQRFGIGTRSITLS